MATLWGPRNGKLKRLRSVLQTCAMTLYVRQCCKTTDLVGQTHNIRGIYESTKRHVREKIRQCIYLASRLVDESGVPLATAAI